MRNAIFHARSFFIAALLVVPVLVIFLLMGNAGGLKPDAPSDDASITASVSNLALLKSAASNMRKVGSYRLEVRSTGDTGVTSTFTFDFDLQGNKTRFQVGSEGLDTSSQAIFVGDDAYFSSDGQSWTKIEFLDTMDETLRTVAEMWEKLTDARLDKAADKFRDGIPATEIIDGVYTKHIVGDINSLGDIYFLNENDEDVVHEGTVELWISMDDANYVLQMKTEYTTYTYNYYGEASKTPTKSTSIFKYSNFNKDFNIEAPPVVDPPTPPDSIEPVP